MPDVTIMIGNRGFDVACQEGEEHFLRAAAAMLDNESKALADQVNHLTESRMLLMAGLMLADRTAGMEDSVQLANTRIAELEAELAEAREALKTSTVPDSVTDTLAEIAARAEAIAAVIEEKAAE